MKIEVQEVVNKWTEYTLINNNEMTVSLLNFGGIITNISVPDNNKIVENVVLSYKNYADYQDNPTFLGAIVGPVAGRIKDASFEVEGTTHFLEANEGRNHLHGGSNGFHQVIWTAVPFETTETIGVVLTHTSADGVGGYPGNIDVTVTYTLNNHNELIIDYVATTDQTTALTLTNHSYFNLTGNLKDTVHNHEIKMNADQIIELDNELIATGNKIDVSKTPFDFQSTKKLGDYPYDHYFIFNSVTTENIIVKEDNSGRMMKITTNQPGVVMYSAHGLDVNLELAERTSTPFLGVCFETQVSPASLHYKEFPSVILKAGETYEKQTVFSFTTI